MSKRAFWILSGLVVLAAFAIREWFVLAMVVPEAVTREVAAFIRQALHLSPDASLTHWFAAAYQLQVLLGTGTVAAVIVLGRLWMPRGFALLAGAILALQPHHIAATGTLLPDVLFGACIVAGLLLAAYAVQRGSNRFGAGAGAAFGFGYLLNPVIAFLPFLLGKRKPLVVMAAVALIAVGGWTARNALVGADGGDRARVDFVQGAWPDYHRLWHWPWMAPAKVDALNAEVALIRKDTAAGIEAVAQRMANDRSRYARWYLSKPWLLFDWEVRIGHGMTFVVQVLDSPLHHPPLLMTTTLQFVLNPLLFALAFCGIVLGLVRGGPERMAAIAVLYFTAVHVVLQAEPRYGTAYRSLEILLACSTLAFLVQALHKPRIAAIPCAPCDRATGMSSGVIPPMA